MSPRHAIAPLLVLGGVSCSKVPIFNVDAGFTLADVSWYEEEETLFIFYEVSAEQGIGDPSLVEITYATDAERVDWTRITDFPTVHTHLPVDCGANARCGSTSIHVPLEPRNIDVRLRYHRDGELSLDADTIYNVVETGDPHSHRSLQIYGVFDESNDWLQWRGRHQFPTIRNKKAEELGLRREFSVTDQRHGRRDPSSETNPYGYGIACPTSYELMDLEAVGTNERAVFNTEPLPLDASDSPIVCASSTVTDATGTFTTSAIARKNPEVRPAFPELRSPIVEATPLKFFLAPCDPVVFARHEEMQRQRLQMEDTPTTCVDDWENNPLFVDTLIDDFTDAIAAARPDGEDMVLVVGLHHDDDDLSLAIEEALAAVTPAERHETSPRLAGAFVFDSVIHAIDTDGLASSTLWCPASILGASDGFPDASVRTCAVAPDNFELELGPLSFGVLPILPSREQYLDFIDTYSEGQAGTANSLSYLTPEFSTTSDHFDIGELGVVTFLDDELITAAPQDAFSYCAQDDAQFYAFRTPLMQSDFFDTLIKKKCGGADTGDDTLGFGDLCDVLEQGLLPIELLPEWHELFGEGSYELGVLWDFPFLLRMEYETSVAGSLSAFGLSVPFGLASDAEAYYGTPMWTEDTFSLEELLLQCRRFCDLPTFGSAGVYRVNNLFRPTYAAACYDPSFPSPGDSGFPVDP